MAGKRQQVLLLGALLVALSSCDTPTERATLMRNGRIIPRADAPVRPQRPQATTRSTDAPRPVAQPLSPTWQQGDLNGLQGAKLVRIYLHEQRGELLVGGRAVMGFPVCTGRNNSTPTGRYHILEKRVRHRSNLYHVSMPYFMRLTYDGIGMHIGDVYNRPVSHGCVRLPGAACRTLYRLVPVGTPVEILRS
ncbi:MAG: L,D-transpeptidase family protein [Akkermansia sp.]